jgi:hypothetical protein
MNPRLTIMCLGGLAGGGAVVCWDQDEGLDEVQGAADGEAESISAEPEAGLSGQADGGAVH